MPRRKNNAYGLIKRTNFSKTDIDFHLSRKAIVDDIYSDGSDCMQDETTKSKRYNDNTECKQNDNYLHKKFKKIAEVTEVKTTIPTANGFDQEQPKVKEQDAQQTSTNPGRYICPYCQLACAKPSVLQKHIRAHTNERPYPCSPCGFAFKTKSNLYKHCRSQAHRVKTGNGTVLESGEDSEGSRSPTPERNNKEDGQAKIYKPKFHKLYVDENDRQDEAKKTPSSEFLHQHITKIISDNQAIVETMEPKWTKKFLQRQNSKEKDEKSYLKVNYKNDFSHILTYQQPLNLTKKEVKQQSGSVIKELLIKARELGQYTPETMAEILSDLESKKEQLKCEHCGASFTSSDGLKVHRVYYCEANVSCDVSNDINEPPPLRSPGPLLGNTPLVEKEPPLKKRRIHSTTVPPDVNQLFVRRLSTSSLPATTRTQSPTTSLRSLEELSKHPMKPNTVNMFGGEVKILDCGETKTMRIEANSKSPIDMKTNSEESSKYYMTIAKTGFHSGGGTLVQITTPTTTTASSSFQMSSILSYPDQTKLLLPLAPNITTPNLTIPGVPTPNKIFPEPGVVTILHAGKPIPYVPGIPGPQNQYPEKSQTSSLTTIRKTSLKKIVPNDKDRKETEKSTKFLRPTSLPLKAGSFVPKRLHQGITPTVLSLVSPETPRPKKSYGQLYLNGHAYTYLGLKCSTRSYYCTISRPQPMYVILGQQHSKLSMYSNWKVYSESEPNPFGLSPARAMSMYDTRHRTSVYTIADSKLKMTAAQGSNTVLTHSSYWLNKLAKKSKDETVSESTETGETAPKRVKIFAGGYESNEEYTYVKGRGRGRYVCEECGIRCKKPSMLKKHIRTHTDVRPYVCNQCNFSFKTKGNLTKHMKSKAHYKKCIELNVNPVPTTVEAENIIEELLVKQQAMRQGEVEDSDDNEDEDDGTDEDDNTNEETDQLERDAACSLLSLSEVSPTSQQFKSVYISAGLLPKTSEQPNTYPYNYVKQDENVESSDIELSDKEDDYRSNSPIDLRKKDKKPSQKTVPAYLLNSLNNANLQHDKFVTDLEDSRMLQAYLQAKALQDVKVKQQQQQKKMETEKFDNSVFETSEKQTTSKESEVDTDSSAESSSPMVTSSCEKPESVQFTVETSSGKKILVTLPAENDRTDTPPPGLMNKMGDSKLKAEFFPPSSGPSPSYVSITEDGRSICVICNKIFTKPSQLRLHVNIHYFERPFRCEACAVSFRTKGHLQKHERSVSHHNKVSMNTTFGTATVSNPRPFKCDDCKIAFRIHGHLAKHLRSKMHIMKLECTGKLPFGTYAEMERCGINLNEIDTTDCENSLESLQLLAQKLYEKDPTKLDQWDKNGPSLVDLKSAQDKDVKEECDTSSSDGYQSEPNDTQDNIESYYINVNKNKPKNIDISKLNCIDNDKNNIHDDRVQINCSNDILHSCTVCDEKFESLSYLQIHLFAEHNKDMIIRQNKVETVEKRLNTVNDSYMKLENQIKTKEIQPNQEKSK